MRVALAIVASIASIWFAAAAEGQDRLGPESRPIAQPNAADGDQGVDAGGDDPTDAGAWRARIAAARARHDEWSACIATRLPGCDPSQNDAPIADDPMQRLFNDDTLVSGDVVSTTRGLKVFRGKPDVPHAWPDFQ